MYVNGDPVNLSDPTGHRYTAGCEDGGSACASSAAPPVMPCSVKGTCSSVGGAGLYGAGGSYHAMSYPDAVKKATEDEIKFILEEAGLYAPEYPVAFNGYGPDALFECFGDDTLPQCQRGKQQAAGNPATPQQMLGTGVLNALTAYAGFLELKLAAAGGVSASVLSAVSDDSLTPDEAEQLLTQLARTGQQALGPGSGPVYGTNLHSFVAGEVEALDIPGLRAEVSFLNGQEVKYGTAGSVRLDQLLTDEQGNPVAVFDLKTGSATLTQARINQILSQLPKGYQNIPVIGYSP